MNVLKDYEIPYTGLKIGKHQFSFEVNDTFFEAFEYSEFDRGTLKVEVEMEKHETMLVLHFNIHGSITTSCDRCMEDVDLQVDAKERLIIKFGDEPFQDTDEIIILPPSEHKVKLAQPIFEFIELNMPQKRVHEDGKCNTEMLSKILEYQASEEKTDPRWNALAELKGN